jgi:hypothetical protein
MFIAERFERRIRQVLEVNQNTKHDNSHNLLKLPLPGG